MQHPLHDHVRGQRTLNGVGEGNDASLVAMSTGRGNLPFNLGEPHKHDKVTGWLHLDV